MRVLVSCSMWFRDKTLKIWKAQVSNLQSTTPPGTVVQIKPRPIVNTGNGCLGLLEIQLPGKKRCDSTALVNGFQLTIGESLSSLTVQ